MIQYFLAYRDSMTTIDLVFLVFGYAVLILLILPFHEFAHAYVAHLCGDDTAKWHGRMTLNPFKHLDMWGTLMMIMVGIGYAKPVPVVSRNFRRYKRDTILVSLAGPLSNFLMAVVSAAIFRVCYLFVTDGNLLFWLWMVFVNVIASVNISLMVFNLLPFPPLDGSRLWSTLLPGRWAYTLERYSQYIIMGLFVLLFTGVLDGPLSTLHQVVGNGIGLLLGEPDIFDATALFVFE